MSKRENGKTINEMLRLYIELLIPFMNIRRDMPFPGDPARQETDAEHIFTLSFMALFLCESLKLELDTAKVLKYALTHDLVEAYAGDISVRHQDEANLKLKKKREHAAFLKIKSDFGGSAPWLPKLIDNYEKQNDDESKFVYALDKCMGALTRMASGGARWSEYYPEPDGTSYHKVVQMLRKKASVYPDMLELFDSVHDELDRRRLDYQTD